MKKTIKIGMLGLFAMGIQLIVAAAYGQLVSDSKTVVLFDTKLIGGALPPDIMTREVSVERSNEGLKVIGNKGLITLNRFYALGERRVRYCVRFSAGAKAVFQSNTGDFKVAVDVAGKSLSISPLREPVKADFLKADKTFIVEVFHCYQQSGASLYDPETGEHVKLAAINDGPGGVGKGVIHNGFAVGMQWDYYSFGLVAGSSMCVERITVMTNKNDLLLLIYGDSITQPEGYYPEADFSKAWTQLLISRLGGRAMSSGRGGCQIKEVLNYIRNELPYLKTKYVMVTIGTNGGNSEENLSELVEYIRSQGAIPILNNIPSNEHGTQVAVNQIIAKVRAKYGIRGAALDLPTSLAGDGMQVDKSTMYWENYTNGWGDIYHHPNVKGSELIFKQILKDLPEIFE